jgi:hypothetical protein
VADAASTNRCGKYSVEDRTTASRLVRRVRIDRAIKFGR